MVEAEFLSRAPKGKHLVSQTLSKKVLSVSKFLFPLKVC